MSSDAKSKYIDLTQKSGSIIPVFFQPWYLDAVSVRGGWDVLLYEEGDGTIAGFWVYFLTRKYGRKGIIMPPLVPYSGIWIMPLTSTKQETQTKKTRTIIEYLLKQRMEDITLFTQSFHPYFKNALPFYWKKYTPTLRYTFIIESLKDWSIKHIATNIRNKIHKASKDLIAEISQDRETLYDLVYDILTAKGLKMALTREMFYKLDEAILQHRDRRIILVKDQNGLVHAATYILIDGNTAYMMMVGSDRKTRYNGAVPMAIYHSILEVQPLVNRYDFEGSMLESLFDLFAGFGGQLTPFIRIYKAQNVFWDILYRLKNQYDKGIR